MAYAKISTRYPDGSVTTITLGADNEHPDMLDQLATRVERMFQNLDTADDTAEDD